MRFKKLRKIYRILFPEKLSTIARFERKLSTNSEVTCVEKIGGLYRVLLKNNLSVYLRDYSSSDYLVLEQIFNDKEYQIILSILKLNKNEDETIIIIDAGANVGYTTLFFTNYLKNTKIYSVEPSAENVYVLKKNVEAIENSNRVKIYENGLGHKRGLLFDLNRNFRDGNDWAITTSEALDGSIIGITIEEIIEQNGLKSIDFLKIDIEGAERFIFDISSNVDFLSITKLIAIEIHDEYEVRARIEAILKENHFILMESGELTIGINTRII